MSMVCLVMILFLYIGIKFAYGPPDEERAGEGQRVTIVGKVYQKEWITQEEKEQKVVYLHLIASEDSLCNTDKRPERQNVICYLKTGQSLPEIGSTIKVEGKLGYFERPSNPGQFDAESYYHILKISFRLNQAEIQEKTDTYNKAGEKLYEIRKYFSDVLENALSDEDASVMKTMLLGEKRAVHKEIKALYQRNGIAHILAISGLHISLLGMALFRALRKTGLPVKFTSCVSVVVILLYGFMTGFSISSLRAVIMFMIHMAALLRGRTYDRITAAFLAALLMLIYQPLYLFSSSFLFSFGCIFAIGFLVPALTEKVKHTDKQPAALRVFFLSGAAITMAGIPLQLCFFYQLPLYGMILNLMIIPLMSLLIPGGMLLLLFYKIPVIKTLTASFITGILAVYEKSCLIAEKLPFHTILPGKPEKIQIGIYLLVLLAVIVCQKKLSLWKKWVLVICGASIMFLPGKKELTVTFLDVGQGECIYVESRRGEHFLIDGGSSSVSSVGEYRIIPFLKYQGASQLEAVFVTHPDEDHCNGIRELLEKGKAEGIRVKNLVLPDIPISARNESYLALEQAAKEEKIPVSYISRGQRIVKGDLAFTCLHPVSGDFYREANEYSIVLKLDYGNFSAMLTGDVEGSGEKQMMIFLKEIRDSGRLTVLKVSHHGSRYSTPDEFLEDQRPVYSVISCGKDNSYGHPHAELTERLEDCGTDIWITCEEGAVTFRTDGKVVRVESFLQKI